LLNQNNIVLADDHAARDVARRREARHVDVTERQRVCRTARLLRVRRRARAAAHRQRVLRRRRIEVPSWRRSVGTVRRPTRRARAQSHDAARRRSANVLSTGVRLQCFVEMKTNEKGGTVHGFFMFTSA
jgi:hypothetical protein